jgi:protein AaeX
MVFAAFRRGEIPVATAGCDRLDDVLATRPGATAVRARRHPGNDRAAHPTCRLFQGRRDRVNFTEINLFGVYVAPISLMMVAAWVITIGLRRFVARYGLLRYVWHPSLFVFAVYMIVLSAMVLAIASR